MPERIQLSRKKGWKMPDNTLIVSRPSKWGNPFQVGARIVMLTGKEQGQEITIDHQCAVTMYRNQALAKGKAADDLRAQIRKELQGLNLACWCKLSDPCHATVLLEIANGKD